MLNVGNAPQFRNPLINNPMNYLNINKPYNNPINSLSNSIIIQILVLNFSNQQ